jgi:Zn-finger nucleic acid-binding protein
MSDMSELSCPKCPGTFERHTLVGVEIDQCATCRGIFLDRGELEMLLEAEHRHSRGQDPAAAYTGRRRADGDEGSDPMATQPFPPPALSTSEEKKQISDFLDEIFE